MSSDEIHDELRTVARQVLGKADPDVAQLVAQRLAREEDPGRQTQT